MKRLHVHVSVESIGDAVRFYSGLFGAEPTVTKPDYAKWMLDDPRVNFAVSLAGARPPGLNHLGVQAETDEELEGLHRQLGAAEIAMLDEPGARCCYATGNKHWTVDPSGIVWEMFHTMGEIAIYGEARDTKSAAVRTIDGRPMPAEVPCCGPLNGL